MYIYWSNKVGINNEGEVIRRQGLIVAPEKGGKDPFQPAIDGDTVTAILPVKNDEITGVEKATIQFEEAPESAPIYNSNTYLFAYEGKVYGQIQGESGNTEIKGIIFKAVKSGSECVPENNPGDAVLVITDYAGEELDTPEILSVTVAEKPEE